MRFTPREDDPLFDSVEAVTRGLGLSLIELSVSRHKGSVQVRATVYKAGSVGLEDCSRAHRAMLPRLELAFPDAALFVEVSSPGIDRTIKDASEFAYYKGRWVKCYRTDISEWSCGVLVDADEKRLVLSADGKAGDIPYSVIAKAKLDWEV
ncbi:MAG: ribosome assembly cofactor RimP [Treponema sp.]|jgi:ribosome maturation factor RimP|nr:ribosome assembly cofactor RimP [Treponema sp.]